MDAQEFQYHKAVREFECGQHKDLICLCVIRDKVARMKQAMGPYYFELLLDHVCLSCTTDTPPQLPPPRDPEPIEPIGDPQPRRQIIECPIPASSDGRAEPVASSTGPAPIPERRVPMRRV